MSRQTQNSMLLVFAISGGIGLTAFVALMVLGGYTFSPALFLSALVTLAVAIFLFRAFHRGPDVPETATAAAPVSAPAPEPAAEPEPAPEPAPVAAAPAPAPEVAPAPAPEPAPEPAPIATHEPEHHAAPTGDAQRPAALEGAREGGPDDLKKIKGVGPKLEAMLHRMGFYHYDQIAAWSASEVAWVDDNLEGFKGRVSRDNWVEQASLLASGGETEFSQKVDKGEVY